MDREKALQDVQQIRWEASDQVVFDWFEIWWSSEGLPAFEVFLESRGITVTK